MKLHPFLTALQIDTLNSFLLRLQKNTSTQGVSSHRGDT